MRIHGHTIIGTEVDAETRCAHYHSEEDRIAIKFYCCGEYYPCYECHEAQGCKEPNPWPKDRFSEKAILCGSCGHELSITEYLTGDPRCPACEASFNPGCSLHAHLYFDMTSYK